MVDKGRKADGSDSDWPIDPMPGRRSQKPTVMTLDEALTRLISRAETLVNSMGQTDALYQFADEISEVKVAMSDARDALAQRPELRQGQRLKPRMRGPRM